MSRRIGSRIRPPSGQRGASTRCDASRRDPVDFAPTTAVRRTLGTASYCRAECALIPACAAPSPSDRRGERGDRSEWQPMAGPERHTGVMTNRPRAMIRLSAVICGLSLALSSCTATDADPPSTANSEMAPPSTTTSEHRPPNDPTREPAPDRGVRVSVMSHCGVRSLVIGGRLWLADPPLGGHNPPPGWDENHTDGYFVRKGPRGEFRGDGGQRADFRLAPRETRDPNAGCE